MAKRWGLRSTGFVSDPGGERFLQPLGLYDPNERDGLALPALVVIDSSGTERYRHVSLDFADRTGDEDVLVALESLGLPAIEAPEWTYDVTIPDSLRGYYQPRNLQPYMFGNKYAAMTMGWRLEGEEAKVIAEQHQAMADSIIAALDEWKPNIEF